MQEQSAIFDLLCLSLSEPEKSLSMKKVISIIQFCKSFYGHSWDLPYSKRLCELSNAADALCAPTLDFICESLSLSDKKKKEVLLFIHQNQNSEFSPYISFEELCERWKIESEKIIELSELASLYFQSVIELLMLTACCDDELAEEEVFLIKEFEAHVPSVRLPENLPEMGKRFLAMDKDELFTEVRRRGEFIQNFFSPDLRRRKIAGILSKILNLVLADELIADEEIHLLRLLSEVWEIDFQNLIQKVLL